MSRTVASMKPFWETKRLAEMTDAEWESLCDGCGKCCLVLLEDEDTGRLYETNIACRLFDAKSRKCTDYKNRSRRVRDCVTLSADKAEALDWMPTTCAYRLLANGENLPKWHPLITGDPGSVVRAGIVTKGVVPEKSVRPSDVWDYVISERKR